MVRKGYKMKVSEARVLIYLSQAKPEARYQTMISAKLNIEYNYLHRILMFMEAKQWIKKSRTVVPVKQYWDIAQAGADKLDEAKDKLISSK